MTIWIVIAVFIAVFIIFNKINSIGVHQINASEASELIGDPGTKVLDVRTQGEYDQGHIKGAMLIPVSELNGRIGELSAFKGKNIVVYCHSGNRSILAGKILNRNGFTKVKSLKGGTIAWTGQKYKLTK